MRLISSGSVPCEPAFHRRQTLRAAAGLLGLAAIATLATAAGSAAPARTSVPRRIVSTAPSLTETLFAMGLGDRVVGDTTFCNYPPAAKKLPKVGTFLQPNLETILSLRPDLVVILTNPIRLREKVQAVGLRVLEVDQETVSSIFVSLRQLGDATGARPQADKLAASLHAGLDAVRRDAAGKPKRRVAFIVGRNPGVLEGMVAAGNASYLNELLTLAGGENVFGRAATAYPRVSLEEVLARNPEVIIDMGDMAVTTGVTERQKQSVVTLWKRYPTLSAVRDHRVFAVANDIFVVPGPRMVEAAQAFERFLHREQSR